MCSQHSQKLAVIEHLRHAHGRNCLTAGEHKHHRSRKSRLWQIKTSHNNLLALQIFHQLSLSPNRALEIEADHAAIRHDPAPLDE